MKRVIILAMCSLAFVTGCASKDRETKETEKEYTVPEFENNHISEDFKIYDGAYKRGVGYGGITLAPDGRIYYLTLEGKKIIDINRSEVYSYCDIADCTHTSEDGSTCKEYQDDCNIVCTDKGYYYTNGSGNLYYKENETNKIVFTNDFYYKLDAQNNPDHKTRFGFFIRDDVVYIIGREYVYLVDANTWEKITEPVVVSDTNYIIAADVQGKNFWFVNDALELCVLNFDTGELKQLAQNASNVVCEGGKTYFTSTDKDGASTLYAIDAEGTQKLLIEDINSEFEVFGDSVVYTQSNSVYLYDINAQKNEKLLEGSSFLLSSCPSSDYVYVVDYNSQTAKKRYKSVLCVNKKTKETSRFELICLVYGREELN